MWYHILFPVGIGVAVHTAAGLNNTRYIRFNRDSTGARFRLRHDMETKIGWKRDYKLKGSDMRRRLDMSQVPDLV